jgi:nucleoside-diphosphate-sugar epimerase
MSQSVLIVGCGFVGLPLAQSFASSGWKTHAITASKPSAASLQRESFAVHAIDIAEAKEFENLPERIFDVVVHCASSGRGGAADYARVFFDGVQNLKAALEYRRLIFTSSTSVYAQTDGSWVDETGPAEPVRETGQILRKTEELVIGAGGAVARLAGLYGPGRCAPLEKLLQGKATIQEDGCRLMNMCHQLDAAGALRFLAESEGNGLFNVVDNEPVSEMEWFQFVCQRLHKPLPPTGPRDLNRKRGWTNKRVSNQKLRSLGWNPIYPTFKEGMAQMLPEVSG